MSEAHPIYPHSDCHELVPGVWQLVGSLPFPLKRNMTIIRRPGDELLLYSVIALNEEGMHKLEALGRPTTMVVPHFFHVMDAPFYKARYPNIRVVAESDARHKLEGKVAVSGNADQVLGELGIRHHVVPGLKYSEIVLDLDLEGGGRGLIFTDLLSKGAGKGLLMRILGPPGGRGVARIVRYRQIADRREVRRFLEELAALPDLRLIAVAHGPAETEDCAGWLRDAARQLG